MENFINIGFQIETIAHLGAIVAGATGLVYFLRVDWRSYGLLFVLATLVGNILCYLFVTFDFYSYPYLLLPWLSIMPITAVTFSFPIMVLFGVRFSPEKWGWKIPFYWTLIHIGMTGETWALARTDLIEYGYKWDLWDSYTWWWIYFLIFEWIGGLIIPQRLKEPISVRSLQYGKLGWAVIHFVLILTIFLAGYYLGSLKNGG